MLGEEEKFLSTVALASRQVQEAIDERARRAGRFSGPAVFRFYDTFGLPIELIEEIAEEEQFDVDRPGFEESLAQQKRRSRSSGAELQRRMKAITDLVGAQRIASTSFSGYDDLSAEDLAVVLIVEAEAARQVESLASGEEGVVVLERTPFYAEAGGQVGDRGVLQWQGGQAEVTGVQKTAAGVILHQVRVIEEPLTLDARVSARVDPRHRLPTQRNHTATHLLHARLRRVLGESVRQAGSLVAPDRLRFDFTHSRPLATGRADTGRGPGESMDPRGRADHDHCRPALSGGRRRGCHGAVRREVR